MISAMSDLERRSGSRPSRRKREQRAYNLVMAGGALGARLRRRHAAGDLRRRSAGRSRSSRRSWPSSARCSSGAPSQSIVAEAVGRALASLGVDAVFGLLGSGNLTVTNALRDAGVPFHASRHEGGAICMADGYGRVSGRLAACSVHQGPGLTNTVTGPDRGGQEPHAADRDRRRHAGRRPALELPDRPGRSGGGGRRGRRARARAGRRRWPTSRAPCGARRSSAAPWC